MDLKQLEYIEAIGKYGNMTRAAEHLFITPSALNQQLLKLEQELNIPLFTRNSRQMKPTEAGQVCLKAAQKMLALRQMTYSHLQDLADCKTGSYEVGLTVEHGCNLFARIYPLFHQRYPGISIQCHEVLVRDQLNMLKAGQLDLAFTLSGTPEIYPEQYDLKYIPLSQENLLLGLPLSHPLAGFAHKPADPYTTMDFTLLKNDYFATALKNSTMRLELLDPMFKQAGYSPRILMETSFNSILQQLSVRGICDVIVPQSCATNRRDVAWFYLPGHPRFEFGVAYQKMYRLNRALQDFIELAREDAQAHLQFDPPPEDSSLPEAFQLGDIDRMGKNQTGKEGETYA